MHFSKRTTLVGLLFFAILLAGCRASTPAPENTPPAPPPQQATATPAAPQASPTPTALPERTLVLCLQEEPSSLYLYANNARSMWSVLEAVYDGPMDTRDYGLQPVILTKIPTLQDGDAALKPLTVKAGDNVVDVDGNLVALKAGTRVLPAGCSRVDCAVTWDGSRELAMDQLVVSFKLLAGLKWSDGSPLTSADSVYSYTLAADPATPTSKNLTDRTFSYKALDELTVEWTGMPGFYEQRFGAFFWTPLPRQVMGHKSAADLLQDEAANRAPLGWGPYAIQEWTPGDHITLRKNPYYFQAAQGLPGFDTLVYRFIGQTADGNLNALLTGECDAVDQNPQFVEAFPALLEQENQKKLKTYVGQGPEWEHLDFGIRPAAYDDGYNPAGGDRPDLFGDARTRQALAYCIDRASINANLLYGRSQVPTSFLPANHPQFAKDLPAYAFDPNQGMKLLDEVGWKDPDHDPQTARVAVGVQGVPDGTPFHLTYLTTQARLRQQVAQAVATSLSRCGVQVTVKTDPPGSIFAPGPDGPVFGRRFDLAQFSWEASARPNCYLYTSAQIPTAANQWIGANVTGFSSAEYDAACAAAYWARPADPDFAGQHTAVQARFAEQLPVLPLYADLKIAAARPDLCGLELNGTARSIFWNLEKLDYGGGCP